MCPRKKHIQVLHATLRHTLDFAFNLFGEFFRRREKVVCPAMRAVRRLLIGGPTGLMHTKLPIFSYLQKSVIPSYGYCHLTTEPDKKTDKTASGPGGELVPCSPQQEPDS